MFEIENNGIFELIKMLADSLANPLFMQNNIIKEINNVNSEISMRMTFNKKFNEYKFLKEIGDPRSKLFSDGFQNILSKK